MTTKTITMTGRPPVSIRKEAWPRIAGARYSDHDGEVECQAFRRWSARVAVRRHADGRHLVFGVASYTTAWRGERDAGAAGGELLPPGCTADDVVAAISRVAAILTSVAGIPDLTDQCIADLPAEPL